MCLGFRKLIQSKFHTQDTQMLGATVQNSDATTAKRQGFLHPRSKSTCALITKEKPPMYSDRMLFLGHFVNHKFHTDWPRFEPQHFR